MHRLAGLTRAFLMMTALAAPAAAQSLDSALRTRVDGIFSQFGPSTPGCALGVYRNGAIAYSNGYGMANLEHNVPITPGTVFDIGSTSKQFTAASILLLANEGKLSLDDEVRKWVTELPAYSSPVTIRQLLHHTSGLRDYLALMGLRGINFDGITTDRDALDLIVRQKDLNFTPGSEYLYSNSGYFLLGEIVRRVSGKSLRAFAEERIFNPLGMTVTHYHDDHTMLVPNRATGYEPRRGGAFAVSMSGFEQTGDGAVYTTVEELLKWDNNFYDAKVGGPKLLDEFHVRGILNNGDTLPYARGLFVDKLRGLRRVSHGGAWAGYRAELMRFPDQRTSLAVLCNQGNANPTRLADRVAEILLESQMESVDAKASTAANTPPAPTTPTPPADLRRADYTGEYYSPELDITYRIRLQGTSLLLDFPGNNAEELTWREPDQFSASGNYLRLAFQREGGQVGAFTLGAGRARNIRFEKKQ